MSSQTYKTLNPAQKEQALLQSAILEDDSKSADKLKKMTIPENVTCHVVGENYRIHNKKEKEKLIQLRFQPIYQGELLIFILQGVSTEALDRKKQQTCIRSWDETKVTSSFFMEVNRFIYLMQRRIPVTILGKEIIWSR